MYSLKGGRAEANLAPKFRVVREAKIGMGWDGRGIRGGFEKGGCSSAGNSRIGLFMAGGEMMS